MKDVLFVMGAGLIAGLIAVCIMWAYLDHVVRDMTLERTYEAQTVNYQDLRLSPGLEFDDCGLSPAQACKQLSNIGL
jgi:hypothetical protein